MAETLLNRAPLEQALSRGLFSFYLINHPALVKQVLQETNQAFDKNSVIYDRFRNAFCGKSQVGTTMPTRSVNESR